MATSQSLGVRGLNLGRPPIPHEHGAWVILYAPLVAGFAAARHSDVRMWLLLTLVVTFAFLGREAAGLLLRKRAKAGAAAWLGMYAGAGCLALLGLAYVYDISGLLIVGLAVAVFFAVHTALMLKPSRKRQDRTVMGELVGAAALTTTGVAAYALAAGSLDLTALAVWIVCWTYFAGSILCVKMRLEAAKHKKDWSPALKHKTLQGAAWFHTFLLLAGGAGIYFTNGLAGGLFLTAFAPSLIRALVACLRLSTTLPNFTRVGILEAGLGIWFTVFTAIAFHTLI